MLEIEEKIRDVFEKYKEKGIKKLNNGAILICRALHVAPKAWTHSVYPALTEKEVGDLEKEMNLLIPNEFKVFLLKYNGLSLFNNSLNIYGLRKNYKRDEENIHQPFDLLTPNVDERISDANDNLFFIGGYRLDGSKLYINTETGNVFRCARKTIAPLNKWDDFNSMLLSEIDRLSKLFDLEGKKIREDIITTP